MLFRIGYAVNNEDSDKLWHSSIPEKATVEESEGAHRKFLRCAFTFVLTC